VSFLDLAIVCAVALAGPLLATPLRWHLPVVLGELLAGLVLGVTVVLSTAIRACSVRFGS
jgi:Kef-type K+ transport system membrane component KefB